MGKFTMNSTLGEILADKDGRAVLEKYLGNLINHPIVNMLRDKTIGEILTLARGKISDQQINAIKEDLFNL